MITGILFHAMEVDASQISNANELVVQIDGKPVKFVRAAKAEDGDFQTARLNAEGERSAAENAKVRTLVDSIGGNGMTDFSKATPRPWVIGNRYSREGIFGPGDRRVASTHGYSDNFSDGSFIIENDANAALIIDAVNSYDANRALIAELVEALEGAYAAAPIQALPDNYRALLAKAKEAME